VIDVDFHEDMKDLSIAMVSTSALLLTILTAVHISYGKTQLAAFVTVFGLYMTIAAGLCEYFCLIRATRVKELQRIESVHNMLLAWFVVQAAAFAIGLFGISMTIILTLTS
jgi:hypothetical protein